MVTSKYLLKLNVNGRTISKERSTLNSMAEEKAQIRKIVGEKNYCN
jgi:hypothetical protein